MSTTALEPDQIPADFPVQPIDPDDPAAIDPATCGTCELTWDDGIGTTWTPAPSGRCPFEYFHRDEEDDESDHSPTNRADLLAAIQTIRRIADDETISPTPYAELLAAVRHAETAAGFPLDANERVR